MLYDPDTKRPIWCPVQPDHDERYVEDRRVEFIDWLAALYDLQSWCAVHAMQLRDWRITRHRCAFRPGSTTIRSGGCCSTPRRSDIPLDFAEPIDSIAATIKPIRR